uniref:Uncharacterized protein LOC102803961 n=1 Tax=Saccoglossus kowalevskii TaxID=10224 RepID=A0ABM0M5Q0_SACKO|nr:PREDICTED: uncharacterized protein LOC102803961 [Saccoglossus kowalevskii]
MDNILLPENFTYSTWASVVLGYAVLIIIYALQFPAMNLSKKIREKTHWLLQLTFEGAFVYIAGISVISIWRGIWYVYDIYILPEDLADSCWITVTVGAVILYVILAGRSLGAIECLVDGIPSDGSGLYFLHYLNVLNAQIDEPDVDDTKDEVELKTSDVATQTAEIDLYFDQFVEVEINQNIKYT